MLEVNGSSFVAAIDGLRDAQEIASQNPAWLTKSNLSTWLDALLTELNNLECRQTIKKVESVRFRFERETFPAAPDIVATSFNNHMQEVWSRLKDELEDRKLYCLSSRQNDLLQSAVVGFGPDVARAFPGIEYDLEEAAKALAFERGTASVFHLMRAMDMALVALGSKIGATVRDKNGNSLVWGILIANCRGKVELMPKGTDQDSWEAAISLLFHVKEVWRNNTMHPLQKYTLEEATEIFDACRAFMRKLALLV